MRVSLMAAALFVAAGTSAFAQDQSPPKGGHGPFMQACGADIQNFCATAQSREDRHACIDAHKDKFSDSCKLFMASHQMHHHDQMQAQPSGGQ